mgnify:CR=1 FL=1
MENLIPFIVGAGLVVLFVIALIALLVLGPERLPGAARTAGLWIGRIKRSFNSIKAEVEREIGALHQRIDILAIIRQHGDAHRTGDLQPVPVDPHRPGDFVHHFLGQRFDRVAVTHFAGDDEFVEADGGGQAEG